MSSGLVPPEGCKEEPVHASPLVSGGLLNLGAYHTLAVGASPHPLPSSSQVIPLVRGTVSKYPIFIRTPVILVKAHPKDLIST